IYGYTTYWKFLLALWEQSISFPTVRMVRVLTLLKHEMALDYLLAKTGGLCLTLNLTGDACVTLIPDNSDNMTNVILNDWAPGNPYTDSDLDIERP
uniref:Uncharacterized protein n=1 Tax=Mastacembelus armatus TaxID=205130 RepID=A0A7N8YJN6_9TELE